MQIMICACLCVIYIIKFLKCSFTYLLQVILKPIKIEALSIIEEDALKLLKCLNG